MGYSSEWEQVARDKGLLGNQPMVPLSMVGTLPFVVLPMCPSSNNLFPSSKNGKRFKSQEYTKWIKAATPIMMNLKKPDCLPVRYRYTILCKIRSNADGANKEKALTDLAVQCGIIPDDCIKYVVGGTWDYQPDFKISGIKFELEPINVSNV